MSGIFSVLLLSRETDNIEVINVEADSEETVETEPDSSVEPEVVTLENIDELLADLYS